MENKLPAVENGGLVQDRAYHGRNVRMKRTVGLIRHTSCSFLAVVLLMPLVAWIFFDLYPESQLWWREIEDTVTCLRNASVSLVSSNTISDYTSCRTRLKFCEPWDRTITCFKTADENPTGEPTKRSELLDDGTARVACWPSGGGVWIQHVAPVDLDYLKISRFNDTDRPSPHHPAKEDQFCDRLVGLGAAWWSLPPVYPSHSWHPHRMEYWIHPKRNSTSFVAWPTRHGRAGMCIIKIAEEFSQRLIPGGGISSRDFVRAFTMDEKCKIIESMGGRYYDQERVSDTIL